MPVTPSRTSPHGLQVPSRPPPPRLAVVIVSYQCRDLLRECLRSLSAHGTVDGSDPEIHVVDNGSTDGTAAMIAADFSHVHFDAQGSNSGFSAANNRALRRIRSEYALVLNPDTAMHEGTLAALVRLLDGHPRIGIAGCRLVRPDGELDHAARRAFPTIAGALGHFTGAGRGERAPATLAQYRAPDRQGSGPVDAVNGAFMLIRRTALEQVGLFDEGYWLYMEDLDLCYRFKQAGWQIFYEDSVSATHVKAGTSSAHRLPRQNRAFHYGMYRFYSKFYAPQRALPVNLAVYGGIAGKLAISMVRSFAHRRLRGATS